MLTNTIKQSLNLFNYRYELKWGINSYVKGKERGLGMEKQLPVLQVQMFGKEEITYGDVPVL